LSVAVRLDSNGPLDVATILSTLVSHEVPGLTETSLSEKTHRRIIELDDGPLELGLSFDSSGVTIDPSGTVDEAEGLERLVRHWFDLDAEIGEINRHLGAHPRFAEQVENRPGIRVTRHPGVYESSILVVLGQQISLASACTFAGRMVTAYGESTGRLRRFPLPERLAEEPVDRLRETLRVTGARARTLNQVAELFAGRPPAFVRAGEPDLTDRLAAIPGIGPWTTSCVSIRGLGAVDEFPASDAVVRRALNGVPAAAAIEQARSWSPWRSYATARLWAEFAGAAA
jgi:3-methyladenine DNA glycosylase/8-oxoguanine DNA glycosylase